LSAKENRPGVGTGTVEDLAGGLIVPNSTAYPLRIVLSGAAETYIDRLGVDLVLGNVELCQLSPALLQFHTIGWTAGRSSLTDRISQLEHECDRLYMAAFNPPLKEPADRLTFAQLQDLRSAIYAGVAE